MENFTGLFAEVVVGFVTFGITVSSFGIIVFES
jgi:hypothetical protein